VTNYGWKWGYLMTISVAILCTLLPLGKILVGELREIREIRRQRRASSDDVNLGIN